MGNSKVIFDGKVLIDLTADTVTKEKLFKGATAHDASGNKITGIFEQTTETWVMTLTDGSVINKEVVIE